MKKKNKSILQATVFALPFSLKLNQKLSNNFKTDYLTMYPKFKIANEFRDNISIKSISFFFNFKFLFKKI